MSADLEREAREAAEVMIDKMFPGEERWKGTSPEYHRKGYIKGYLSAATLREKEIGELKAHLERANSAATANVPWNAMLHLFRLVSTMQISARKAFEFAQALVHGGMSEAELPHLLSGEPMTGDGDRDDEIATLRARIAELEKVASLADSIAHEFEVAVESRNPVGGMSVPPSGDFISCAQLPSAVGRMRWWAREIRKAQPIPVPETKP